MAAASSRASLWRLAYLSLEELVSPSPCRARRAANRGGGGQLCRATRRRIGAYRRRQTSRVALPGCPCVFCKTWPWTWGVRWPTIATDEGQSGVNGRQESHVDSLGMYLATCPRIDETSDAPSLGDGGELHPWMVAARMESGWTCVAWHSIIHGLCASCPPARYGVQRKATGLPALAGGANRTIKQRASVASTAGTHPQATVGPLSATKRNGLVLLNLAAWQSKFNDAMKLPEGNGLGDLAHCKRRRTVLGRAQGTSSGVEKGKTRPQIHCEATRCLWFAPAHGQARKRTAAHRHLGSQSFPSRSPFALFLHCSQSTREPGVSFSC